MARIISALTGELPPHPSGRTANVTDAEMLAAFRGLRRYLDSFELPYRS
jgi:hypothetical protein